MKKQVSLKSVRNEFKSQTGSLNYCIKIIYAAIEQAKEDDKQASTLKKIMPSSKVKAYEYAQKIAEFGKVGTTYEVTRYIKEQKTTYTITRKPSVDMILKYFTKLANGEI
jgi:hypothetical protein